ncbi:MAG: hypothetical protein HYZ54_05645 [Ignavibacteriae bacterium]|nr:hypothetical protein [Ignavibacteriota bacterium]
MDVKLKIGQRIRELRQQNGLSQKGLSYASDLEMSYDRCPKMCLGEDYMIAIPEYDEQEIKNKSVVFKLN